MWIGLDWFGLVNDLVVWLGLAGFGLVVVDMSEELGLFPPSRSYGGGLWLVVTGGSCL